ncbi:MAG TPA: hypothetical protein DCS93_31205 [Microscillaceae bacterium]|nr:hypothetical protein [Microscillaceae bacterium]
MKIRSLFVYSLLFIYYSQPLFAQISSKELEKEADKFFEKTHNKTSPGTAIVVVKDGKVVLNKGYGLANMEHQIPVTPRTVFDIASVSKQFAAFAIAMLVEQKKLALNDDVRKYIPELPNFGHTITIGHLVHHTSGIRDWTSTLPLRGVLFDDVISFDQILRMAYQQKELNFVPGSEYSYSNTGYNLLVEVIQRVTKQSFRQWTDKHIFKPLGMTHTHFSDNYEEVIAQKALSYARNRSGKYRVRTNQLTALGSSSLHTTTTDMAKWLINLDNPKIGGEAVNKRMFEQVKLNNGKQSSYAFGLDVDEIWGAKRADHSGSWAAFQTYMVHFPEHRLSLAVFSNHQANPWRIALRIAKWYIKGVRPGTKSAKKDKKTPAKKSITLSKEALDKYVGMYRFGAAWYVTITREGDQLMTQATNEDKFPMTPTASGEFWVPAYRSAMVFKKDATGKINRVHYRGKDRLKMKPAPKLTPERMATLVGRYWSEELQTAYEVIKKEGKLYLLHFRHGQLELTQAWNDDFSNGKWFLRSVQFERNAQGKATGFRVTNHRARNQLFAKVK